MGVRRELTAYQKHCRFNRTQPLTRIGDGIFYLKRYPEAVQTFEKAVQMNPGDEHIPEIWRMLTAGWAKDKANASYDKAISLAYKQLQVNPRDATIMGHWRCTRQKGDSTQAKESSSARAALIPLTLFPLYLRSGGYDCERTEAGDRDFADRIAKRILSG